MSRPSEGDVRRAAELWPDVEGTRWSVYRRRTNPFDPGHWYVSNSHLDQINAFAQAFADADDARAFAFTLAYGVGPYCACGEPYSAFTRTGTAIHNGCGGSA